MNLTIETGVPVFTVFVQGLLSFFSPCILPLVPLYISYLTGGMYTQNADGSLEYPRKKLFIQTLFFVLGIGFAFILLGLGFTAVGRFFSGSRLIFTRIGPADGTDAAPSGGCGPMDLRPGDGFNSRIYL